MFGMTEAQFAEIATRVCTTGLIVFMLFIIGELARKSKAGRAGTRVLFLVLALGMGSFIAKTVIELVIHV